MSPKPLQLWSETLGQAVGREQMRLICPNCDAEYEVDDNAIPDAGRDVQCSNCGHAWFQAPAMAMVAPEPAAAEEPLSMAEDAPQMADVPAEAPRSVDASVLAILKEEAETELAARRAEAVPVEVQPDLGIDAADAAAATARAQQIALMKGEEAAAARARQVTRRELLPDIEEINSTLRPSPAVQYQDADDTLDTAAPARGNSGFRSGFVLMLLVAAVLVTLYLMAPRLAQQIPGVKAPLDAYVAMVDQARIALDAATQSVIGALQRLAGSE